MSGYEQTVLVLPEMPRKRGEAGVTAVWDLLVEHYELDSSLEGCVGRLEFDSTGEWTATSPVDDRRKQLYELIAEHRWIRISGDIQIAGKKNGFEIYFYPASVSDQAGFLLRLESSAYQAVYVGQPPYDHMFSDDARDGLISLCLSVADAYGGEGFIFEFDSGTLIRLNLDDLRQRLLRPVLDNPKKRPGLVTGIRNSIIGKSALDSVWSPSNVIESTTGYLYIALMRPENSSSQSAGETSNEGES